MLDTVLTSSGTALRGAASSQHSSLGGFIVLVALATVVVVTVQLTFVRCNNRRAEALVRGWAEREGYRITGCERLFLGGSFLWETTRYQRVYKVTLLRADGQKAIADVRFGTAWGGIARTGRVEPDVRWRDKWGYPAL